MRVIFVFDIEEWENVLSPLEREDTVCGNDVSVGSRIVYPVFVALDVQRCVGEIII